MFLMKDIVYKSLVLYKDTLLCIIRRHAGLLQQNRHNPLVPISNHLREKVSHSALSNPGRMKQETFFEEKNNHIECDCAA